MRTRRNPGARRRRWSTRRRRGWEGSDGFRTQSDPKRVRMFPKTCPPDHFSTSFCPAQATACAFGPVD
eukprot:2060139-Prymnesium_polylepis.1